MRTNIKLGMIAVAALVISGTGLVQFSGFRSEEITDLPDLVVIPAGDFIYRQPGQFRIGTRVVDAPLRHETAKSQMRIMKYHVSQAEYDACVQDGACMPTNVKPGQNLPQVAVSYVDATAYARWFSKKTRLNWRLPSATEWRRAAGNKYIDDSLGNLEDENDPAQRWLLEYARQVDLRGESDLELRPRGANGHNDLGLYDISANVWEWTDTCFQNAQLDASGQNITDSSANCSVRVVEGKHAAYIIDFVRDARVGGCAAGIPPDHLGFRLILDS